MTDPEVVRAVIRYLGRIAFLLAGGSLFLVGYLLQQSSGNRTVDPAAVGAVMGIVGSAGTVAGMLGTILVSVRSGPSEKPSEPIETKVVNGPNEAVPVDADAGPG